MAEQIKDAMRAKDSLRLNTLRAVKSALKYKMVEKKTDSLTEQDEQAVLKSLSKQRQEAADQYKASGATEQAEKELAELKILQEFLPEQMSEEAVAKMVSDVVGELGASSMKDMGAVMKELSARTEGKADGKLMSELVKKKLGSS